MIILAQSDTTAGFLSQDENELNILKNRDKAQKCVITTADLSVLKNFVRVPQKYKILVRRAKKTSFLYPNLRCLRVVKDERHSAFLKTHFKDSWAFSTSANEHGKDFNINFATKNADKIFDLDILCSGKSSKIYKIGKNAIKKIR